MNAFTPVAATLRAALVLGARSRGVRFVELALLTSGYRRGSKKVASDWVRQGWFSRAGVVYHTTAKGLKMLDAMETRDRLGRDPRPSLDRVYRFIDQHGAISVDQIRHLLHMSWSSAAPMAWQWTRAGLLRKTHHNTYRRPLEVKESA